MLVLSHLYCHSCVAGNWCQGVNTSGYSLLLGLASASLVVSGDGQPEHNVIWQSQENKLEPDGGVVNHVKVSLSKTKTFCVNSY